MSESLILVLALLLICSIFFAASCWMVWRDDKDLHARIDAAAALRGEMAPLPPRAQKSQPEPAIEKIKPTEE